MEENLDQVIKQLNYNPVLNFVAVAVTIQHVNGIDACLAKFEDKGISLKGYVLLQSHPKTGRKISENLFYNIHSGIYIRKFKYICSEIKKPSAIKGRVFAFKSSKYNNADRIIYVALPEINYQWIPIIEQNVPGSKVCYILLDDGGGSYSNRYKDSLQMEIYNNPGQFRLKFVMKVFFRISYMTLLIKRLEKSNRLIDNRLFSKKKENGRDIYLRNEEVVKYYDEIYTEISKIVPENTKKLFEGAVVINTQCLLENKITDGIVDLELYSRVVTMIKNIGGTVVIKPHPRELDIKKYDNLECKVYNDNTVSQEAILAALDKKPKCIISIFSSTLLNAYGLFEIPIISLAKLMLKQNINLVFKRQLEDFINQYNGIFAFPETEAELEKQIKILI